MSGTRESFPHRYSTDPGGPNETHLTRADFAHYDLRLVELSTSAPPNCGIDLCARAARLTEATMMFLDCPAWLDRDGAERCGLPAEVSCRFTMRSTDGPIESAMIRCPAGHYFCGAIESLTWDGKNKHDPGSATVTFRARRVSVQDGRDGRDGADGSTVRDYLAEPDPDFSRPNTAPAFYLGRPARLWITVMRPRRRLARRGGPAIR